MFDAGLPVRDAVEAPRQHWDGEQLQVEPGLPDGVLAALRERWPVNAWDQRSLYFGGVHVVAPPTEAAADPRREGHATVID